MDDGWFDDPVSVMIEGPGKVRMVSSAREAAECLLFRWPSSGCKSHLAARKACMAVLEGQKKSIVARRAFAKAAEDEGVLINRPAR
ncbi:DUF982 domain-containing protein [Oryzicola mucosus]|uniref:DUF982 domain-containing protein n=1 Tax=Oryzicola mucosus TaxID=2767425 RepID=A0A8J6U8T4_9HYPH|nr:DUF982 domain-containing protein [Oryzicola mucosus]MBD0416127.1 DUF982 domain-containing protein [Oryzicola mucosus]